MHAPRTAAVVGAGVMGAQIAAHLANAGLEVLVLDVSLQAAQAGIERLRSLTPAPLFLPELRQRLTPATLDAPDSLRNVDWVIEAIAENIDVKRKLLEQLDRVAPPDAIISSNTSAISLNALADGRSQGFRRRWLGTHFFNPPRYLPLVELIPVTDTAPEIIESLRHFLDWRLGKNVVVARDTPGFIANRLGVFGALRALDTVTLGEYQIEDVDAVTGPVTGRPKSATFRTLDIAGLDVFVSVADDLHRRLEGRWDAESFRVPGAVRQMVELGLTGQKRGQGFYRRAPNGERGEIETLEFDSLSATSDVRYRTRATTSLTLADAEDDELVPRLRRLFTASDRTGALVRATLGATLVYAARVADEIAQSIDDIDRAMRWGFGWQLGPFEMWDALGIDTVVSAMALAEVPQAVRALTSRGRTSFRDQPLPPVDAGVQMLTSARRQQRVVQSNEGASLIDLGDGVLCVEFHSKMNALGGDAMQMILAGVERAAAGHTALVIGSEAELFSAGANLMLLLLEAQEGNWDEVDLMVRTFQSATTAIKTAAVPVVAAPAGLALGGGCEICLHADRVHAAAETYLGLVETGVGLIPAGGGTKEMLLRAAARDQPGDDAVLRRTFETIALARVSTSAPHARELGYLRDVDSWSMHRERTIAGAKRVALERAPGYTPTVLRRDFQVGGAPAYAVLTLGVHLAHRAGRITDHDARVARALARVLAGGDLPHAATVSEEYLLDLEREAFLSLCGEPKTLERIAHTLRTGKPLRN